MNKIATKVNELVIRYGTANPEDICENMGIIILSLDLPKRVNGFTIRREGIWFIVLNQSLSYHEKRFTTAHELGHILLHNGTNSINLSCNTCFCVSKYEKEADCFAAYLLLKTAIDCMEYETLTVKQISQLTHIPEEKVHQMFFHEN